MKFLAGPLVLTVAAAAAALAAPPSGRPPTGPLERVNPRIYDVKYDVTLTTMVAYVLDDPRVQRPDPEFTDPAIIDWGGTFRLVDTPIIMPLIYRGTFSAIDPETVKGELFLNGRPDLTLRERFRVEDGLPHAVHLAVLPITAFEGKTVRWNVAFQTMVYASKIDDAAAARLTWPREWPAEVQDGLSPQMYIESDDPMFAEAVERVSEGKLRMVPPYLAAKDLIRYCLQEVMPVGSGQRRGALGVLHGMNVEGARIAALEGRGSPHDLVCVCVAMLRAAGIPARPVIGVRENDRNRKVFASWAEFYLEGAGWIPFDPRKMRGSGAQHRDVQQPWPHFGSLDDLNEWIPLSYHFMPPRAVESPMYPAIWGWDPRPEGAPRAEQRIQIGVTSRGQPLPPPPGSRE